MTVMPNAAPAWAWNLPRGCARRIGAAPAARWLIVAEGLIWLTATSRAGVPNPDRWLADGQSVRLPAGTEWVVEGRGAARYSLVEPPPEPACARLPRPRFWLARVPPQIRCDK